MTAAGSPSRGPEPETGAMFVEAATRVGLAYAASLALFAVLMQLAV